MRIALPAATMVFAVLWLAGAVAFAPAWRGRPVRRAAIAAPITVAGPCPAPLRQAVVAPPVAPVEEVRAAVDPREAGSPPPSAAAACPGPSDVAAAVAELEECLGGPDFAPTMESVRRSLIPLLASNPCAVEDALARALDLRAAGEVRAVLVEALAAGPGAARAAEVAPALLLDPSPLVRNVAWRQFARRPPEE